MEMVVVKATDCMMKAIVSNIFVVFNKNRELILYGIPHIGESFVYGIR